MAAGRYVAIGRPVGQFPNNWLRCACCLFKPQPFCLQIVEWLRAAGPVAMGELTRRFKKRLCSDAQRKAFGATIKKIAVHKEVTPGAGKVILLKPGV